IDGYRVIREGLDGSETIVVEGIVRARPGSVVTPEMTELPPVAEN
ncbi:MAG: efflux transporter periplasmic adaptor subunit, partial [Pseudomonadota bacterium]